MKHLSLKQEKLESELDVAIEYGCRHKFQYTSMNKARQAASWVKKKYNEKVHAYKCAFCRYYHIGHKPKKPIDKTYLRDLKTAQ